MNDPRISADDPRLTAYALGELPPDERAVIEAAVRADPALQAVVDETRALAAQLQASLANEPEVDARWSAAPAGPSAPAGGAAGGRKLLRFPRLYYVTGGLAAAGFAVLLAIREQKPVPSAELELRGVATAPAASSPAVPESGAHDAAVREGADAVNAVEASSRGFAGRTAARGLVPAKLAAPAPVLMELPRSRSNVDLEQISPGLLAQVKAAATWGGPPPAAVGAPAPAPITFGARGGAAAHALSAPPAGKIASPAQTRAAADTGTDVIQLSAFEVSASAGTSHAAARQAKAHASPAHQLASISAPGFTPGVITLSAGAMVGSPAGGTGRAFVPAATHSTATFRVAATTGGMARLRRSLLAGQRPSPTAITIEELVNHFGYGYRLPNDASLLAPAFESAPAPWASSRTLLRLGLKAGGNLGTVAATDVSFTVEFNPSRVHSYRLLGYDQSNGAVGVGGDTIVGRQAITALCELVLEPGAASGPIGVLHVSYRAPAAVQRQALDLPIVLSAANSVPSADFQLAAAAAELGLVLREWPERGSASAAEALTLASSAAGPDATGDRAEFIALLRRAVQVLK